MSNIEVAGLGALNTDNIYKVRRILGDGEAVIDEARSSSGGSAANTIYGLAKLGINAGFAGIVGDDAEGRVIVDDFQKVGVDTSQIRVKPGIRTGSVFCLSDSLGKRSLYVLPGANSLLTLEDLDLTYINQASLLHLSSFADDRQFEMLLTLIDRLDLSTKISFSPGALYSSKGLKALTPILARTYLLFTNRDEIRQLTGEDVIAGAENCLKQGCHIIVVTLGRGMRLKLGHKTINTTYYIRDTKSEYTVESNSQSPVFEVDTTGAGDAFASGFLYGLLKGKGLEECGRLGDIAAHLAISSLGTRQGLPSLGELTQHYQELYPK